MNDNSLPAHAQGFYDAELARPEQPSKVMLWTGWILSVLPMLLLVSGGVTALMRSPKVLEGTAALGFPASMVPVIGTLEIVCALLYLVPRTAVLGALLLTAYFGGAVVAHARLGQPQWFVPVLFGIVIWLGLLLRRPGLRRSLLTL